MSESAQKPRLRILHLEDNSLDQHLIEAAATASDLSCDFVHVRTGAEYEAALHGTPYDLIFSDFKLPGYHGTAALMAARKVQPETPFLLVSGTIGEERAVEILKAGATDFILKDHLDRLAPAMERALREVADRSSRRQAEEALATAQQRLAHVLAQSPAIIYLLERSGPANTPAWVSENLTQLLGCSASEACRPGWWASRVHPDDGELSGGNPAELITGGQTATEYRMRHEDGTYRWVRDVQKLLLDEKGQPLEIIGSWMDITERKHLEEQLRQAQKMEAIGQLAGGVAHDFNNLLTVIQGNAEFLLLDGDQLTSESTDALKQIAAAAERAGGLTRQLLLFSRKQMMQTTPLNLEQIVIDLSRMLRRLIGEDIHLQCNYAGRLPWVQADAGMIEQVLMNLAVNARDAMPRGGELLITTQSVVLAEEYVRQHPEARAGEFVCLSVTDSGQGISREHLPRIFEPFFTTKEVGKGTGLGLATVHGIVKQHRGWIEVLSPPGKGATFNIYLPAIASPVPAEPAEPLLRNRLGGSETILLVEDDFAVRILVHRLLEHAGYRVCEAPSGREALEKWEGREAEIDLLLTDLVMPGGLSGQNLAERLRVRKPDLKVMFTSGYSPELNGRDAGAKLRSEGSFLQKPYSPHMLIESVRRCLDEHSDR